MRDDEDDQGYDYASSDSEAYAYDSRDERSEGESSFEAYEDDLTSE